jgi:hypothetical protein
MRQWRFEFATVTFSEAGKAMRMVKASLSYSDRMPNFSAQDSKDEFTLVF